MNVYGYIPANYFPSHATLTYWAQAASFAGLPSSESAFASTGLVLGLKKSQLPLTAGDVAHKSRNTLSPSSDEEFASLFRVAPRMTSHSVDHVTGLTHQASIEFHAHIHHQQQLRKQQQQIQHHHQTHHFFNTSPPLGSGLAPLQALCQSDVSAFTTKTSASSDSFNSSTESKGSLKFGMSRILSDDFGKSKCEKENNFQLSAVPESCRSLTLCPCNSAACTAYARPPSPYHKGPLPTLSAVHALQPPTYPLSSSVDALPGPYSILSTDSSLAGQPKRKRSWSRAVFSNLQRKGLEKRFEVQKYVTKPDRRQLAAMLGLTDAQVKVWFQNRRMKWRHAQQQGEKDKQIQPEHQQGSDHSKQNSGSGDSKESEKSSPGGCKIGHTSALPESLRHACEPVSSVDLPERDTTKGNLVKTEAPSHMQLRPNSASPQDLSIRLCATDRSSDRSINMPSSLDFRTQQSMETTFCCQLTDLPGHDTVKSPDNDVIITLLRHKVQSSNKDGPPKDLLGHKLDFDTSSSPCVEIDSDVDVHDTDVDIHDTDVDMNDSDDNESDMIIVPKDISLRDITLDN